MVSFRSWNIVYLHSQWKWNSRSPTILVPTQLESKFKNLAKRRYEAPLSSEINILGKVVFHFGWDCLPIWASSSSILGRTSYNIIQHQTTTYNFIQQSYNIIHHHNIIQNHTTLYNIIQHHKTSHSIIQHQTTSHDIKNSTKHHTTS